MFITYTFSCVIASENLIYKAIVSEKFETKEIKMRITHLEQKILLQEVVPVENENMKDLWSLLLTTPQEVTELEECLGNENNMNILVTIENWT